MSNNLFISVCMNDVLSDLWSLHLAMIGCLVSVFTLLYSFLISKKGDLKIYAEQLSHGDKSPTIIQRQRFATGYIKKISQAINLCLLLLLCNICLSVSSWIGYRLLDGKAQAILLYIVAALTILVTIFMIALCVKVYAQYRNDARV